MRRLSSIHYKRNRELLIYAIFLLILGMIWIVLDVFFLKKGEALARNIIFVNGIVMSGVGSGIMILASSLMKNNEMLIKKGLDKRKLFIYILIMNIGGIVAVLNSINGHRQKAIWGSAILWVGIIKLGITLLKTYRNCVGFSKENNQIMVMDTFGKKRLISIHDIAYAEKGFDDSKVVLVGNKGNVELRLTGDQCKNKQLIEEFLTYLSSRKIKIYNIDQKKMVPERKRQKDCCKYEKQGYGYTVAEILGVFMIVLSLVFRFCAANCLKLDYALLILAGFSLIPYIYCYISGKVIYIIKDAEGIAKGRFTSDFSGTISVSSAIILYCYLSFCDSKTAVYGVGKILLICVGFACFLSFVMAMKLPDSYRIKDNILLLFVTISIISYPVVHSILYVTRGEEKVVEMPVVDRYINETTDGTLCHNMVVKMNNGKEMKLDVSRYVYYNSYYEDTVPVIQNGSLFGIKFISFQEYDN